jgi:hypothetical protein
MSPVSRGRKPKKSKNGSSGRSGAGSSRAGGVRPGTAAKASLTDLFSVSREEPAWFGPAITVVLDGSEAILTVEGPRALEEAVVELVGGQVRHAVRDVGRGLWVEQWFALLVQATATRVRDELVLGTAGWEGPWRQLHSLGAMGSPALAAIATTAARRLAAQAARVAEPRRLHRRGMIKTGFSVVSS